jgi:hypothetical protein
MGRRNDDDREDFLADWGDGSCSYDEREEEYEPGYDPGPDDEDSDEDPGDEDGERYPDDEDSDDEPMSGGGYSSDWAYRRAEAGYGE